MTDATPPDNPARDDADDSTQKWYQGITRYQWLVLIIASAGWIFDVYEGQIFNLTRHSMLEELVVADSPEEQQETIKFMGDVFLGIFLAGGMVGGLIFGMMGDRWGRRPTMILTILMYSVFSGLTYFATNLWQVGILRFLVSMGIGGEWAVAAALVSEVFPTRARANASAIFHGSSTLGIWLAGIVSMAVGTHWRYAYLVGVLPALLVLWVRSSIKDPVEWQQSAVRNDQRRGSLSEMFRDVRWRKRAIGGMFLAAVGLATFWAVCVAGQDLARLALEKEGKSSEEAEQSARFAYGIIQATGAGVGLIMFGPFCQWLGRRRAFMTVHVLAVLVVPATCFLPQTYWQLLVMLPFYGAFTTAMHAGYAVYFPELFPARMRALGASVCFNGGRIIAAVMLPIAGYMKGPSELDFPTALTLLSLTYLLGLVVLLYLPETKGQPLPE
jgi:MFS family permease